MTKREWIVCERSGKWAAALRMTLASSATEPAGNLRLYEVRTLRDLTTRLTEQPQALALLEVQRSNFAETLIWLTDASDSFPRARSCALIDRAGFGGHVLRDVAAALLAAGAAGVSDSPRDLRNVLTLGGRQAVTDGQSTVPSDFESFSQWAWELLPWQST